MPRYGAVPNRMSHTSSNPLRYGMPRIGQFMVVSQSMLETHSQACLKLTTEMGLDFPGLYCICMVVTL